MNIYQTGWKANLTKKQELHHYWGWSIVILPVVMALINTLIYY